MDTVSPLTLTFGSRLNVRSWNEALTALPASFGSGDADLAGATVKIDLTDAGFADFVTLGNLLVLIDAIVSARAHVVLLLPSGQPVDGHRDSESARRQRQRQQCELFLEQSGFTAVARSWGNSAVTVESVRSRDPLPETDQVEEPRPPRKLRRVLPYRWLTVPNGVTGRLAHLGSLETAFSDIGLSSETVAAVAEGLLTELIAGFGKHQPRRRVLVGACIVAPASADSWKDDFNEGLRGLIGRAARRKTSLVRMFVGGSARSPSLDKVIEQRQWVLGRPVGQHQRRPWKVAQIVRSYQGGLIVSSGGRSGGAIYAEKAETELFPHEGVRGLPCSIVECDLLLSPGAKVVLSDHEVETPAVNRIPDKGHLNCVTVTMRSGAGIDSADLDQVHDQLISSHANELTHGVVVAVNAHIRGAPPGHSVIMKMLRQVLGVAHDTPGTTSLVVALPGVNRRLLALAVDDLCAEEVRVDAEPTRPVLVVISENRHYWLGASSAVRTVLGKLSGTGRACSLRELTAFDSNCGTREAVRWIREKTMLVDVDSSDDARLKVSPEDAVNALTTHLARQTKAAIESGNHRGVLRGKFLTPGLRTTNRWCDVHELLAHSGTEQLAGFALACKVRTEVRAIDSSIPLSVLRLGTVAREFASAFTRSLTGSDRYFNSAGSLRLDRASGILPELPQVLIVTGLVVTEDDLAIAHDELEALGIRTVAVAALVDARESPRGDIPLTTSSLALVSLTQVDVGDSDGLQSTAIDPLLEGPDGTRKPRLRTLVDQEVYVGALGRTRAARLAHIARPAGRHYTAYVDPTLLFRSRRWAKRFNLRAISKIRGAQHDLDDGKGPISTMCIAYPAETTDNIADVARGLGAALAGTCGIEAPKVVPIARAVLGTHWLLPASVPLLDAEHIVVLDSATGTGRTIQQMLRVAAAPHVRLITCIVLLNGLDELDALALQQITTISGTPVSLYFLARSAVSSLDARDCDVCALRRAYEEMPLLAPLPPNLEEQRTWLLQNLTPRSKRRAFEEEATDLAGMHINQDDCVEYLRWKYDLREAATSTSRRRDVVDKLEDAKTNPRLGDAVVRLLCAERSWLRSPPLSFTSVRRDVTALATGLVLGEAAWSIDPSLRVQALILLADVQPFEFIRLFADLLMSNHDHYVVTRQVLLESLRLIAGPGAPWRTSRQEIVQRFIKVLSATENEMRERSGEGYGDVSLFDIRYLISHARRRLLPTPTDKQSAWDVLRAHWLLVDEHYYETKIFPVIANIPYLSKGVTADREAIKERWHECAESLTRDVLPNLAPLRALLLSPWVVRHLTDESADRWEDVIKGRGQQVLDDITIRMESVLANPEPAAIDTLMVDLRWWDRFFLAKHVDPGVSDERAFLSEIVRRCPADPIAAVEDVFASANPRIKCADVLRSRVFCDNHLLRDILIHVRTNAESRHRTPGVDQRFEICLVGERERIEISILNTGSHPGTKAEGKGLRVLAEKLAFFEGRLARINDTTPPWSYGVLISLERWRMA